MVIGSAADEVSIHAPVKEATSLRSCYPRKPVSFNPRPREGGDKRLRGAGARIECFNPRPREGGDYEGIGYQHDETVSIHAPVKEATKLNIGSIIGLPVSIHAPVKEATHIPARCGPGYVVSIHAPVKEATGHLARVMTRSQFQSTPP